MTTSMFGMNVVLAVAINPPTPAHLDDPVHSGYGLQPVISPLMGWCHITDFYGGTGYGT
jgi:hypothetical protein